MKKRLVLNEDLVDELEIEPIEEIPVDVIPEEPVLVEPEVKPEIVKSMYVDMLQDLLRKQWDVINASDSLVSTIDSEESPAFDKEKVTAILKKLSEDITVAIGMTTKAMAVVDPSQEELMNIGVEKADEVIETSSEDVPDPDGVTFDLSDGSGEPVEVTVKDGEIVEESLDEDIHDEFKAVDFSGEEYYDRYWEEEALYNLEYRLDNIEDEDEDSIYREIENLTASQIMDICRDAADSVRNSDYLWEQVREIIDDSIDSSLSEIQKERESSPVVEIGAEENKEGE